MIALAMWNRKRLELASAESITHHDLLNQARALYSHKNYTATLRTVRSILNSNHLGGEAKLLHDIVIADIHREISHYSSRIETDSQDAGSYLSRARYYHCLGNKDEARADMNEYQAILNPSEGTDAYEDWFMAVVSQEAPAGLFFGTPENLGPAVNSEEYEWFPRISDDGLSLYFSRNTKRWENWITTRATQNDPWNTAVRLLTPMQARNRDSSDSAAMVLERRSLPAILASLGVMPGLTTMDGLELYGWDARLGGYGDEDIFVMKRETIHDVWTDPCNIGSAVNTQYAETLVSVSPDGLELYFCDNQNYRPGGQGREDLWMTRRASRNDPWQEPENLGPNVNSPANDSRPHVSADGLLLFFDSRRPGGYRESDLYVTKRKTTSDPWEKALNLGPRINAEGDEYNPCISADRSNLFFVRNEDLWQVSILNIENKTNSNSLTRSTGHLRETDFAKAPPP
jgi:hypothetical protein